MRRRDFIATIGGAAAMPLVSRAQQAMPVIGYFSGRSSATEGPIRGPFLRALEESGFTAGRNIAIEYRFSEGRDERLPNLAADLVGQSVSMLVATDRPSAVAAKAATATIPIVFTSGLDPVQLGLVTSLNRPGGNVTGATILARVLVGKQLEILHELVPSAAVVGFLVNPKDANEQLGDPTQSAASLRQKLIIVKASTAEEIEAAFNTLVEEALVVDGAPFILSRRKRVVSLAQQHSVPAIYAFREPIMEAVAAQLTKDMFVPGDTDAFDPGLPIGAEFPEIRAMYAGAELRDVDSLAGSRGTVFIANRSVVW
jgi:putative ABC transport system substrate-binding protein